MMDFEAKFSKPGVLVYVITEAFANKTIYILVTETGPSKTQDQFENFSEAFDSFTNVVKTLTKEMEEKKRV